MFWQLKGEFNAVSRQPVVVVVVVVSTVVAECDPEPQQKQTRLNGSENKQVLSFPCVPVCAALHCALCVDYRGCRIQDAAGCLYDTCIPVYNEDFRL